MHFIVDENVPTSVERVLIELGHTVSRPDPGTPDIDICQIAQIDGAIILTQDHDFSDMVFRDGVTVPGLVLVRMPNALPNEFAARITDVLSGSEEELNGNVTVIETDNVRTRLLP